jgi:hypothetical protein
MQYLNTLASAYFLIYLTQLIVAKVWLYRVKNKAIELINFQIQDSQLSINGAIESDMFSEDKNLVRMVQLLESNINYFQAKIRFLNKPTFWLSTSEQQLQFALEVILVHKVEQDKILKSF